MARMTPQSLRMAEQLDRGGGLQTERERLDAREHATLALADTCTIQTRTLSGDGQGGQIETWADTYTAVKCRLLSALRAFGDERVFAGRLIHQADYLLVLAHGQALTVADRIADVASSDGVIKDAGPFEILAVGKVLSERVTLQALLRRAE